MQITRTVGGDMCSWHQHAIKIKEEEAESEALWVGHL